MTHEKPGFTSGSAPDPQQSANREIGHENQISTEATDSATEPSGSTDALEKLETENADLKDRLLRALAEVENVRRRGEREVNEIRKYAISEFARDMLKVADNMERAISSVPRAVLESDGAVRALLQGVEITEKEMISSLEKHGVTKLNPVGQRFDPNFHEALLGVVDPSVPDGTVTNVLETGYSIGARPLRPAKVAVARGGTQIKSLPGRES